MIWKDNTIDITKRDIYNVDNINIKIVEEL